MHHLKNTLCMPIILCCVSLYPVIRDFKFHITSVTCLAFHSLRAHMFADCSHSHLSGQLLICIRLTLRCIVSLGLRAIQKNANLMTMNLLLYKVSRMSFCCSRSLHVDRRSASEVFISLWSQLVAKKSPTHTDSNSRFQSLIKSLSCVSFQIYGLKQFGASQVGTHFTYYVSPSYFVFHQRSSKIWLRGISALLIVKQTQLF